MKNFLFLSFLSLSSLSIGQTQETKLKNVNPQPIQQQQVSKINRIDKRITPIRSKEKAINKTEKESIKQD